MMKNVLIGLLALLLVAGIGGVVLVVTFDADRYRPQLISQLEQAMGRPVTLDRIALGWQQGLAIQLHGFAIYERAGDSEPLVRVESADAVVNLTRLLQREIEISSVVLQRPVVRILRDANGVINVLGLAAVTSPTAASGQTTTVGDASVAFRIGALRIQGGTLEWHDASVDPPVALSITALNVDLGHLAPGKPVDLELTGSFAADAKNIRLSGHITPPGPTTVGAVDNLHLSIEKVVLDRVLPPIMSSGF